MPLNYIVRLITLAAGLLILTSCATANYYTQTVQSWRGANANKLIESWGSPDDKVNSANGNTIFVYHTESYSVPKQQTSPAIGVNVSATGTPVITTPNANTAIQQAPEDLTCTTKFEVNKNNIIVNADSVGNACFGGEGFAMAKSNPRGKLQ